MSALHPTRRISFKLSEIVVYFYQEQDGYFLFFRFRMATINKAMLTIRLNSSYVLIRHHSFPQDTDRVGARPPTARVNILCFGWCPVLTLYAMRPPVILCDCSCIMLLLNEVIIHLNEGFEQMKHGSIDRRKYERDQSGTVTSLFVFRCLF